MRQEKLTPTKVLAMLKDDNSELTLEQADTILSFMRLVADIVIERHLLGNPDKGSDHRAVKK